MSVAVIRRYRNKIVHYRYHNTISMSQTIVENPLFTTLVAGFEQTYQQFTTQESPELLQKRKQAFTIFEKNRIPTTKNEEWHFTSLTPFIKDDYRLQSAGTAAQETIRQAIEKTRIPNLDAYQLVMVNGVPDFSRSDLPKNEGIKIQSVAEIKNEPGFAQLINRTVPVETFSFAALNTAYFEDGFFIEVAKNFQLDKPIQITHIYTEKENVFLQPRNIVNIGRGGAAEILEASVCISDHIFFVNSLTEITVAENAHFKHAHFQRGNINERWIIHTQVQQMQDSRYDNYTFTLPKADLVRNNLNVVLDGTNTESHLYGLYMVDDKHLVDNHSLVDHRYPNCMSNQLYKGVILDGGKGVFNGKIYVHREAQKTNAFQQNNNLLFSPNGTINSKPQLEIFADDVKCSHGSTVGQFDDEAIFYLRSRGIGEETAHSLMVTAFAFDVTNKVENEALRNYIEQLIEQTIATAQIV